MTPYKLSLSLDESAFIDKTLCYRGRNLRQLNWRHYEQPGAVEFSTVLVPVVSLVYKDKDAGSLTTNTGTVVIKLSEERWVGIVS